MLWLTSVLCLSDWCLISPESLLNEWKLFEQMERKKERNDRVKVRLKILFRLHASITSRSSLHTTLEQMLGNKMFLDKRLDIFISFVPICENKKTFRTQQNVLVKISWIL